ncbi:hypothetical protein FRC12_023407 [Ceratobasidium sp. 428]|nr:hypothetical protein FRC12_023407 [Ceratobasidium sp. 428]
MNTAIRDVAIALLDVDLPRPPATYVGPAAQFRSPDGSGYNPAMPNLGKAGTPYARSVQVQYEPPLCFQPRVIMMFIHGTEHDADPIWESSFPRACLRYSPKKGYEGRDTTPNGLFRNSPESPFINDTSSYLDLSPLYGHDLAAQMKVRRNDGTGRLYEDVFAENRLLLMPPSVSALLVMFSRNHNKLYQINEQRTFKDPKELRKMSPAGSPMPRKAHLIDDAHYVNDAITVATGSAAAGSTFSAMSEISAITAPTESVFLGQSKSGVNAYNRQRSPLEEQDHVLFNTARLINCGFFMNIITSDYISTILGLACVDSSYSLNSFEEIRGENDQFIGRGQGNTCSVEFNLLYRWHATLSAADEKWTEEMMKKQFGVDDPTKITWVDFVKKTADDKFLPKIQDITQWTFRDKWGNDLKRDPITGRFRDCDLAGILHDATENVSGAFSARNTPEVMKIVEVMGIMQARKWGVCTLNEFRKFIGLKPYESFKDWNPRKEIYEAARGLYGHPDNLELYVGMQAEEAKSVIDGAGLCPGYTISRAILADAVALTRGDRFLTQDFIPKNLTVWGFQDCQRDVNNGAFGGMLSKILMRNLPEYYAFNSVYAFFPFLVPSQIQKYLTDLGVADQYDFRRPREAREVIGVNTHKAVREVLSDAKTYSVTCVENMNYLTGGYGFFLAMDDPVKHQKDMGLMHKVMATPEALARYTLWYGAKTTELIDEKSFSMSKSEARSVDIVRDVLNLVPVYWVSQELAGLPLKCEENEGGLITEQELYGMLATIFSYIFLNIDPVTEWRLRDKATEYAGKLQGLIQGHLKAIASKSSFSIPGLKAWLTDGWYGNDDPARALLANLYKNRGDLTIEQISYNVFGCMIASGPNYSMAATLVVDFYLSDERQIEREAICGLVLQHTPESDRKLSGYIREAMRLRPQVPGIFRDVNQRVTLQDGDKILELNQHNRLFVSLANSGLDSEAFPDPQKVDPERPRGDYNLFGFGTHKCMGDQFTEQVNSSMIIFVEDVLTIWTDDAGGS